MFKGKALTVAARAAAARMYRTIFVLVSWKLVGLVCARTIEGSGPEYEDGGRAKYRRNRTRDQRRESNNAK